MGELLESGLLPGKCSAADFLSARARTHTGMIENGYTPFSHEEVLAAIGGSGWRRYGTIQAEGWDSLDVILQRCLADQTDALEALAEEGASWMGGVLMPVYLRAHVSKEGIHLSGWISSQSVRGGFLMCTQLNPTPAHATSAFVRREDIPSVLADRLGIAIR